MRPAIRVDGEEVAGAWLDDRTWVGSGVRISFGEGTKAGPLDEVSVSTFAHALDPQVGNRHERRARAAKGRKR